MTTNSLGLFPVLGFPFWFCLGRGWTLDASFFFYIIIPHTPLFYMDSLFTLSLPWSAAPNDPHLDVGNEPTNDACTPTY